MMIYATNIKWDVDVPSQLEYLPTIIKIDNADLWKDADDISDYISDVTGFCHDGFSIECDMTIKQMYDRIEKIDKMLALEYEDGETVAASNLELEREALYDAICLMEEEFQLQNIEPEEPDLTE